MENTEHSESHIPEHEIRRPPIEIGITPFDDEAAIFRKTPEGGYTIFLRGEITLTIHPPELPATESPVRADEAPENSETLESPPQAPTGQSQAATEGSTEEEGNKLHEFSGNPATNAKYWEWKKSGKRVADFVLATHPEEGKTEYKRIRAFDGLAVYVRDNVRKGQTDVEVQAYGEKYWATRNKKQITGYYAKNVKVPKRYRQGGKD
jgi:hypothetical protein